MLELYTGWNLLAFVLMMIDKHMARRSGRRIPERILFLVAFYFGSAGILFGMYTFRHKTRHRSFVLGMPVLLLLNIAGLYWFPGK